MPEILSECVLYTKSPGHSQALRQRLWIGRLCDGDCYRRGIGAPMPIADGVSKVVGTLESVSRRILHDVSGGRGAERRVLICDRHRYRIRPIVSVRMGRAGTCVSTDRAALIARTVTVVDRAGERPIAWARVTERGAGCSGAAMIRRFRIDGGCVHRWRE